MDFLVQGLLELSRIDSRPHARPARRSRAGWSHEVLDGLQYRISERGIAVRVDPLPAVHRRPGAHQQVFGNLIDNAVKYMQPDGEAAIHVGCVRRDGLPQFFVRDTGVGIRPEDQAKIFRLFGRVGDHGVTRRRHRADGGEEDRREARRQDLGGIGARSGQHVLVHAAADPPRAANGRTEPWMQRQAIKILLVEDDDGHARLIERNLRKVSLANPIDRVRDGQEALRVPAQRGRLRRPAPLLAARAWCCSTSTCRAWTASRCSSASRPTRTCARLPVIMLTSTDNQAEIDRCYSAGASGYVAKPVNIGSLGEKLQRLGMFLEIVELPVVA